MPTINPTKLFYKYVEYVEHNENCADSYRQIREKLKQEHSINLT